MKRKLTLIKILNFIDWHLATNTRKYNFIIKTLVKIYLYRYEVDYFYKIKKKKKVTMLLLLQKLTIHTLESSY